MRKYRDTHELYLKLYPFWAIADGWCWDNPLKSPFGTKRYCWMPKLEEGRRRLNYKEFCELYNLDGAS